MLKVMVGGSMWIQFRFLLLVGVLSLTEGRISFAGERLANILARGELVWGADQEGGGPFVFPSPGDPERQSGFEVELAALIAESLGVKPRFAQSPWDKLPDLVDRGDIDIVLNGYEWSPQRAARFGCSIPYYIYELQLLGRKSDTTLQSWEDLFRDRSTKRVAVLGGAAAQYYLERVVQERSRSGLSAQGSMPDVVLFEGVTDAMRAVELATDGMDANLQDLPIWIYYRRGFPDLREVGPPVGRGYYVALVRKDEAELLSKINAAILAGLQDGRLRKVFESYGMWNRSQAGRGLEVDANQEFAGDLDENPTASRTEQESVYVAERGWSVVRSRGGLLIRAAGMTVILAVIAMPLAVLIGLQTTLVRMYGPRWLSWLATAYVEIVRGTPLVLQLYVIFFLLPEIGISLHAFWAAILALAINYSAYEAEIYRAGIQAIPRGQMEAALALGMNQTLALRRVIVPQATRIVIPPMTNDFIALFKDTAVCSVITVVELSKQYYVQARSTGAILELGLLTALLYLAMSYPLSKLAASWERRLSTEQGK
jgi:polar amino acid transport system substrate-binding protein